MDKIKTVKIKNPDGSVSEETYTISVDAKNVDMKNGKELQETIGTIDIDKDGSIAEQLAELSSNKINTTDIIDNLNSTQTDKVLSAKQGKVLGDAIAALEVESVKKKPYYFNTVADMKADTRLKNGDMVITLGYYTANDGGDGKYRIVSGDYEDDGENYHKIDNNLYAELIINGKTLTVIEDLNSENKYKYRYKYSNNMVDNSFYVNNKIITNYDNIADLSVNIYLRESGSFTHIMDLINIYKQIQVQKLVLPLHLYYDNGYKCYEMNHSEFLNTVGAINNIIPIKVLKIHCTDANFSAGLVDNNEYIAIIEDLIDELSFLEVDTLILYNEAQYYYTNTTAINSITIPTLEHFKEKNLKVSISMSNAISVLYTNPELINAMDIICCNEYPSLGHNVKESNYKDLSQYFNGTIEVIKKIKRLYNKPFILSEIGIQDS